MFFVIIVLTIQTALVVFIPFALSWVVLVSTVEIAKRNTALLSPNTTSFGLAKPIALSWLASCTTLSLAEVAARRLVDIHLFFPFATFGTCFCFTYQYLGKGVVLESEEQKRWRILASFLPAFTIMVLISASFSIHANS